SNDVGGVKTILGDTPLRRREERDDRANVVTQSGTMTRGCARVRTVSSDRPGLPIVVGSIRHSKGPCPTIRTPSARGESISDLSHPKYASRFKFSVEETTNANTQAGKLWVGHCYTCFRRKCLWLDGG